MSPPEQNPQRKPGSPTQYVYRRPLDLRELAPAIGAGVAAGVATFYVVRLLLQKTPLLTPDKMISVKRKTG